MLYTGLLLLIAALIFNTLFFVRKDLQTPLLNQTAQRSTTAGAAMIALNAAADIWPSLALEFEVTALAVISAFIGLQLVSAWEAWKGWDH